MPRPDALLDRPSWAPSWAPSVDDVRSMRVLRWVLGGVFVAGMTACVVENADSPADPVLDPATDDPVVSTSGGASGLAARFGTVVVDLVTATGEVLELCLLEADEPAERGRGLMAVTDLEGHDGMLFRWDEDAQSSFVMIDTVTPLSISWWSADGAFVSGADMEPCTEADDADCARYAADGPYRYAIEAFQGELPEAGAAARIEVHDERSCTA